MVEFFFGWLCVVAIVACICVTVNSATRMHYRDQKEIRLEQMDLNLQNPQLAADRETVRRIAESYKKNSRYGALLVDDIKNELIKRNLIDRQ